MKGRIRGLIIGGGIVWGMGLLLLAFIRSPAAAGAQEIRPAELVSSLSAKALQRGLSTPELIEQAVLRGEISRDTADLYLAYALFSPEMLPARFRSDVPWEGTLPLWQLQQRLRRRPLSPLGATVQRLAAGVCDTSTTSLPSSITSANFFIEYGTISGGLTLADYINALETSRTTLVNTFGWAAPPILSGTPGNKYHVRIDTLAPGLLGFVSTSGTYAGFVGDNPNTSWNEGSAMASCMVLRNDFSGFPSAAIDILRSTVAHEFHHAIQFGYGVAPSVRDLDGVFMEASATWVEDEVFDSANDNYSYLWPDFQVCMGEYYTSTSNEWYPYWIVLRGLTEPFGTGVADGGEQIIQDFWEYLSKKQGGMLAALDQALKNRSSTLSLGPAYHNAAIALAFVKPCGGGYTSPYCFEEASGYTGVAGFPPPTAELSSLPDTYNGLIQDAYALNWITLPVGSGVYTITLQNTSGGGLIRASFVGDTGSSLDVRSLGVAAAGQAIQERNVDLSVYTGAAVVITNEAQPSDNPASCTARSYTLAVTQGAPSLPSPSSRSVFLPLITRSGPGGILGRVTVGGSPAGNVQLELRFYDGTGWSTLQTTSTAADGTFAFTGVPSLGSGQEYYVRYVNPSAGDSQGRLSTWSSRSITAYTAGETVNLGTFDIADITLVSPPHDTTATLPQTFQWNPRPATTNDSYGILFFDLTTNQILALEPTVGYQNSYMLNALPAALSYGTAYGWTVYVEWPDGSVGAAYWAYRITFSSATPRQQRRPSTTPGTDQGVLRRVPAADVWPGRGK
ncbi:MAG: hypothetical protein Q9O62_01230 [Ardenticatenia bacterium]|nr:hypothetical protein [Ardenticatenia bacterium]